MNEIWKNIEGYEGYYQISNLGQIRSLDRKLWNGQAFHLRKGKILKSFIRKNGYKNVVLSKNSQLKNFMIHRLVAEIFISNPKNKKDVNHLNGIKIDNRVDNLEWCTRSENQIHAYNTGISKPYIRSNKTKKKLSDSLKKYYQRLFN